MLSLELRIAELEKDLSLSSPGFILTSDLPFAIFRYNPWQEDEGEWIMRKEIRNLATRVEAKGIRSVTLLRLSELYWKSIDESEGMKAVESLERSQGFDAAEEQVHAYLSDDDWRPLPQLVKDRLSALDPQHDLVFMYRAGIFAPGAYRVSALLEQLLRHRVRVPIVLFYPGVWSGSLNFMGLHHGTEPLGSYRVKIYGRDE
jgi:hypothetical protein